VPVENPDQVAARAKEARYRPEMVEELGEGVVPEEAPGFWKALGAPALGQEDANISLLERPFEVEVEFDLGKAPEGQATALLELEQSTTSSYLKTMKSMGTLTMTLMAQ